MKKILTVTVTAAVLVGALIATHSFNANATLPKEQHGAIYLGYGAYYRDVRDDNGNLLYRTEDGVAVTFTSASANTPQISIGTSLGVAIAVLMDDGFRFAEPNVVYGRYLLVK